MNAHEEEETDGRPFVFRVLETDGAARLGRLETPHGIVETPAFMPVGTLGAVKGMSHDRLLASGAQLLMTNLYHLLERAGFERLVRLGGLHEFIGWDHPVAMDSGGYQVFSLAGRRRTSDRGVTFKSPHDGSAVDLTPERVVDVQDGLGVDLALVLDECPPWPVERDAAAASLARTTLWARRSIERWERASGPGRSAGAGLFGIVQGSFFEDLRLRAAADLAALPFDGYAIGGVSVGEDRQLGRQATGWTAAALPVDRPRYLMGLGTPEDILWAVESGVDLFDCVLPSRERSPRHAVLVHRRRADQERPLSRGRASGRRVLPLPAVSPSQQSVSPPSVPVRRDHRPRPRDRAQRTFLSRLHGPAPRGHRGTRNSRPDAAERRRGRRGSGRSSTAGRTAIG